MENTTYNRADALKELTSYIDTAVEETITGNADPDYLADEVKDYCNYISLIINNQGVEQWEFFEQPMAACNMDIKPKE